MTTAQRFHRVDVSVADLIQAGARAADPNHYPQDPDAGFVFADGSSGGFGLYENGALIQTRDGRDLFAADQEEG